jgi:hypothetical protein
MVFSRKKNYNFFRTEISEHHGESPDKNRRKKKKILANQIFGCAKNIQKKQSHFKEVM